MQDNDFLSRVLPPEGDYYVAKQTPNKKFIQTDIQSIDSLYNTTDSYAQRCDTYYATGSFYPNTSREASNVSFKKTFYIDIDCGDGKSYATKRDALNGWAKFQKASGILAPTKIVDSGNGYHLYWILNKPIDAIAWEKIAALFKAICIKLELHADHVVTADASRYLRVPGSRNYKDPNEPKHVETIYSKDYDYTVVEFLNSIKHWVGNVTVEAVTSGDGFGLDALNGAEVPEALKSEQVTEDLYESMGGGYGPKHFEFGKDECLIMQDMLATGGEHYNDPSWKAALNILVWCEDGKDYLHPISDKHPGYSQRETEHKWRFQEKYKNDVEGGSRKGGPTTCNKFAQDCGPDLCNQCPHNGRIKTPLSLCKSPFADEVLPHGFVQNDKGVWFQPADPDEGMMFVCGFSITDVKRNIDTDTRGNTTTQLTFNVHKGGKVTPVKLDNSLVIDYRRLYQAMCNQHVQLETAYNPRCNFGTLMNAWSQQLDATNSSIKTQANFGWVSHEGKHGFSVGDSTVWGDGSVTHSVSVDRVMAERYSSRGVLSEWQKPVQFAVDQNRPQINAVIASSFGAPLMKFTGEKGVIMALVSECSASGKTMALSLGGSVWGNPAESFNSMDDTVNSINNKMGTLSNLPMYWDEVRNLKEEVGFSKLLFSLCQGREKTRMTADIKQQHSGSWATIMVATSNESLIGYVDAANPNESNAGRMRILEFEVGVIADDTGKEIFHNLEDNYGIAGRIYAEYLAKNHDKVQTRVRKAQKKIRDTLKCETAERFWVAAMATTIVGAELATELGLVKFNSNQLKKFFTSVLHDNKGDIVEHRETGSVTSTSDLAQFLNAMTERGIHYEDMDKDGSPIGATLSVGERGAVAFEYGAKSKIFKVNKRVFGEWLAHNNKQPTSVLTDLKRKSHFYRNMKSQLGQQHTGTMGISCVPVFLVIV